MSEITTIGLDVAKHVFQVHGIDAQGTTVVRKRLRRGQVLAFFSRIPRCVVGLEACATAHYWARELRALGHEVRLMPAQYVKAYVKRNKNDAADAEAICEAVQRPTMRRLEVPNTEAHQTALYSIDNARALTDQPLALAVRALGILLRQRRNRCHVAVIWFTPQPADEHAFEQSSVESISFRPAMLARYSHARRVDDVGTRLYRLGPAEMSSLRSLSGDK